MDKYTKLIEDAIEQGLWIYNIKDDLWHNPLVSSPGTFSGTPLYQLIVADPEEGFRDLKSERKTLYDKETDLRRRIDLWIVARDQLSLFKE